MLRRREFDPGNVSDELRGQWTHPTDVFSVLLILGGDVVARALAQLSGWTVGPPSFSFGWVAYSINALVAAFGENKLMPEPDYSCVVVNAKSGYVRNNKSWILGRLVRDYDAWMHKDVKEALDRAIDSRWKFEKDRAREDEAPEPSRPKRAGLCVSIYRPDIKKPIGRPGDPWLWIQGVVVAVLQLGVAAIPCGLFGDWGILMVTAIGIILSSITASLGQWKKEKWACRIQQPGKGKAVVLTEGNGTQHAILILGHEGFLDLEDLASGLSESPVSTTDATRITVTVLALLWILLLITASGLHENTWFLLAVGGIGILFNIYAAGKRHNPRVNGLPLVFDSVVAHPKVMDTLYTLEEAVPYAGRSIRDIFFPGKLRDDEEIRWKDYEKSAKDRAAAVSNGPRHADV